MSSRQPQAKVLDIEVKLASIQEKEAIYQKLADTISQQVPANELVSLIEWLARYRDSFEQVVSFSEVFDAFPQDGAVALRKALADKFGFVESKSVQSFFGARPPHMMGIKTGPNESVQVPWGEFALPGYQNLTVTTGVNTTKEGFVFVLGGTYKRKDAEVVKDLVDRVRHYIREYSIYRGKAISLDFSDEFDPEEFAVEDVAPEFLDLSRVNQEELVLPETVYRMVQDNLFTPVEKTDLCRKFGIPLRRGVLLAGTYGVGKTLTAQIQALKATRNGWTFIYLKNVRHLANTLRVARQYSPAVVFAEDVDSVMQGEQRTDEMNEILNTVDGIELKGKEVLVVLTTNHADRINPAMVRPGRIDALIEMVPPDSVAAQKLLKVYGKGLMNPDADFSKVGAILAGQRPAMIAETVQRSKLSAVTRMAVNETELVILPEDLEAAALGMRGHTALVDGESKAKGLSAAEALAENVIAALGHAKNLSNGHAKTNA